MPTNVLDLTKPGTYPRSGRELVGGVAYLGRAIDKMRADLNGTVGEYLAACPQSRRVYALFGVTVEQFREALQQQPVDQGVLRWLQEHGTAQPSQEQIKQFSEEILTSRVPPERLTRTLASIGHPERTDITTSVDLQDLEEERDIPMRS